MKQSKSQEEEQQYSIWEEKSPKGRKVIPGYNHTPISEWCKDDQPRYKMLNKGKAALSDTETLSVILGAGSPNESSLDLAKKILKIANNNLGEVSRMNITELTRIKGIGQAKALSIIAAFEIGRRRSICEVMSLTKISRSRDAYDLLRNHLADKPYEEFWVIFLNRANRVIRSCCISEGGISGTVVDPKKIFKLSLDNHASSIILGHNHPSGTIKPSEADEKITKKIRDAGYMLDIAVLDHLIIGDDQYYSFADEGSL